MAETSAIEWTDATFNPWWGCEKISPGCAHCYAERDSHRFHPGEALWGDGHTFRMFGDKHWAEPLRWARTLPEKLGRRPRVFTASMADVFEEHPALGEARERLFALIAATPELDWLVLTKRPAYARHVLSHPMFWLGVNARLLRMGHPVIPGGMSDFAAGRSWLPNFWIGTSIENARFTWRADVLRTIPAAGRFLSCEPLLGSLYMPEEPRFLGIPESTLDRARYVCDCGHVSKQVLRTETRGDTCLACGTSVRLTPRPLNLAGIDWVIVGGESGPRARPMHPAWAREIRDAVLARELHDPACDMDEDCGCSASRPALLFKQWGEYAPVVGHLDGLRNLHVLTGRGVEPWQAFTHGSFTAYGKEARTARGDLIVQRPGKKAAGRELDGRTWTEFPDGLDAGREGERRGPVALGGTEGYSRNEPQGHVPLSPNAEASA